MEWKHTLIVLGALLAVLGLVQPSLGEETGFYVANTIGQEPSCLPDGLDFLAAACFRTGGSELPDCAPFLTDSLTFPPGVVFVLTGTPDDPTELANEILVDARAERDNVPVVERLWVSLEGNWTDEDRENLDRLRSLFTTYNLALSLLSVTPRFGIRTTVEQMQELFGTEDVRAEFSDVNLDIAIWWLPGDLVNATFDDFPGTNGFTADDVAVVTTANAFCGSTDADMLMGRNLDPDGFSLSSASSLGSWTLAGAVALALVAALGGL